MLDLAIRTAGRCYENLKSTKVIHLEQMSVRSVRGAFPIFNPVFILMCTMLFAVNASAATHGMFTYKVVGVTVIITDCNTVLATGDVTIPDEIEGRPVTGIDDNAFETGCLGC